jgi:phosphoribosylanthranilate isomerase
MHKTKIKVNDIQNLTDARYFAAMGVDYLGFCCNPGSETFCSLAKIKEITDWVEGPQFVLQFQGFQSEQEIKSVINTGLGHALHFGVFATYDINFELPIFKEFIFENINKDTNFDCDFPILRSDIDWEKITEKDKIKLSEILVSKHCFLDFKWQTSSLKDLIQQLPSFGLILKGGSEERIGVKTFDDLDDIFEILAS